MGSSLTGAVERRGRSRPHDPWLFSPAGLDWSFLTWGEAAARLEGWARALRSTAGVRIAYPWRCRGEDWLLDLALRDAGALPVPVSGATAASLVAAATAGSAEVLVGDPPACFGRQRPPRSPPDARRRRGRRGRDGADRPEAGVGRIAAALGDDAPGDVALVSGSLDSDAMRSVLAWATLAGAAVVFEPSRRSLLATCRWARPTVLLAGAPARAELLERLAAAGERRFGAWRAKRLRGRLRSVVAEETSGIEAEERSRWEAAGVALVTA